MKKNVQRKIPKLIKASEINNKWLFNRAEQMMTKAVLSAKARGVYFGKPAGVQND
jgi:hypothetical protein